MTRVKIAFPCTGPGGTAETETMWAMPVREGYVLDSIPFYATGVSCRDVVSAVQDEYGVLQFVDVVGVGGHSTVRLWLFDSDAVDPVRAALRLLGCASEVSDIHTLIAVDIPRDVDYAVVKALLGKKSEEEVLDYEESCLGHAWLSQPADPIR